jgi:drug/metabolite transporter (DMT)-like permease
MSAFALTLVLIAAFTHATWNLAAKRSGGGLPFVWLTGLLSFGFYIPAIIGYCLWFRPALPDFSLLLFVVSGAIKTCYALLLQRGYRHGDFSLVYPLARGTGPLLSTIAAIVLFGERPTTLALAGGALIVASVFYLTGGLSLWHTDRAHLRTGLLYGLTCGTCIAAYTVWDQHAVSHHALPPVIYDCGTQVVMCSILTPFAWPRRAESLRAWREHRGKILTVALLGPVGYVLILTAMTFTPVSYIAPAREISILVGTFFGAKLLKEADASRRLLAAGGMVAGIIALALG